MPSQVVTIVGVFKGKSGVSERGPWQIYDIKDAGGNRYSTFKNEHETIARLAKETGSQVVVDYDEETVVKDDKTYTNLKLKSISQLTGSPQSASGSNPVPQVASNGSESQRGSQDAFRRSKEELRRSESLTIALGLANSGLVSVGSWAELLAVAANVAEHLESGASVEQPQENVLY